VEELLTVRESSDVVVPLHSGTTGCCGSCSDNNRGGLDRRLSLLRLNEFLDHTHYMRNTIPTQSETKLSSHVQQR
jgi:hypothetical protein